MKSRSLAVLVLVLSLVVVFSFFVIKQNEEKMLKNLVVNIENSTDTSHFVSHADIKKMIIEQAGKQLADLSYEQLDTRALERTLRTNLFIEKCHISRDASGNLVVDIKENKPIARILTSYGRGAYVAESGALLPLSERVTARVLLICGRGAGKMMAADFWNTERGKQIFELLKFIERSKFWKAQIAELHFDENFEVVLFPHVGDERIALGGVENFEKKLENLIVYYKQIVVRRGWQTYENVNLKISNQIICK